MEKIYYIEKDGRKRTGEYYNCEQCGKKFVRRTYDKTQWEKQQKFCSKDCGHLARQNRVDVECDWCHKTFYRVKSKIGKFNFCSRHCKETAQSLDGGFTGIQPQHYGNVGENSLYRKICFGIHEKKCIICGYTRIVDVHHIDNNHKNNDPSNLVPLCRNHHAEIHTLEWGEETKRLLNERIR